MLPQEVGDIDDVSVVEFVLAGRRDLLRMEARIRELTTELASGALSGALQDKAANELGELSENFRVNGGYSLRARAQEILRGMGFEETRWQLSSRKLSGGWKVRLVLAQLLLQRPALLLMDEPTNHLDVPSLEWLEGFLGSYEGTVIIISHDRYFLNRLVNETAALELDGLHVHPGGYDSYMKAREERHALLARQKDAQDRYIREQLELIDRFRSKASKAAMVQSRVKMLEKLERIETPDERKKMRGFRFSEAPAPGRLICAARHVAKSFGENVVYHDVNMEVLRGERVALVGPNGAGKTTLLKIITGRLAADRGEVELGHQVVPGYFGQHQVDELNERHTVLESMEAAATVDTNPLCRGILGAFLFSGDDVQKKVSVLSGGERNRVALARMLLQPTNFLLLDEPTNHLDMTSRDVLQESLKAYKGTILFVSHDRHFINSVATRVVHVEAGQATSYDGDYEYYAWKRKELLQGADAPASGGSTSTAADSASVDRRDRKRQEAEFRQELSKRTKRTRTELEKIESRIAAREAELTALNETLSSPDTWTTGEKVDVAGLQKSLKAAQEDLAWLFDKWTQLSE
ncbi:MAG: ATP-binding cassette domain-containing protein, partial [Myxococcales bacterium]|nr:ATP-binding cassette domain-containing protein [Myxococcales bacterium]